MTNLLIFSFLCFYFVKADFHLIQHLRKANLFSHKIKKSWKLQNDNASVSLIEMILKVQILKYLPFALI